MVYCERCKQWYHPDTTGGGHSNCPGAPVEEYNLGAGHLQGWECPKCGSVYGPFVQECERCKDSNVRYYYDTGTGGYQSIELGGN